MGNERRSGGSAHPRPRVDISVQRPTSLRIVKSTELSVGALICCFKILQKWADIKTGTEATDLEEEETRGTCASPLPFFFSLLS